MIWIPEIIGGHPFDYFGGAAEGRPPKSFFYDPQKCPPNRPPKQFPRLPLEVSPGVSHGCPLGVALG